MTPLPARPQAPVPTAAVTVEDIRHAAMPRPQVSAHEDDEHTDVVIRRDRARTLRPSPAIDRAVEACREDGQSTSDLWREVVMSAVRRVSSDPTDWAIQWRLAIPRLEAEDDFRRASQRYRTVERRVGPEPTAPRARASHALATAGLSAAWDALLALDGEGTPLVADSNAWSATAGSQRPPVPRLPKRPAGRAARPHARRTTHLSRMEDALVAHVCSALGTTPDALLTWHLTGAVPAVGDERPISQRLAMAHQAVATAMAGGIPPLQDRCDLCGSATPL